MRAREFISEKQVDEIAPIIGALGGALLRGGAALGGAALRGLGAIGGAAARGITSTAKAATPAVGNIAKQAASTAATSFGTTAGTNLANRLTGQEKPQAPLKPVELAPGVKVEPVVSKDPNKLGFKIGGGTFSLDLKDPANAQIIQQLGALQAQQK